MRILFIGDIFGNPGRRVTASYLAAHAGQFDLVIANGENATSGRGLSRKHYEELRGLGIDLITLGNHTWDQREAIELVAETPRLLRAANYPPGTPGLELSVIESAAGERLAVAQLLGRVFMQAMDDPFQKAEGLLESVPDGVPLLVDFHAEATSEKRVLGWQLRGQAAAVVGTHTHVQTADEMVVDGTAYITDVGMTSIQDSAIGMAYEEVHYRLTRHMPKRFKPAEEGRAALCGVILETSGTRCTNIERINWSPGV